MPQFRGEMSRDASTVLASQLAPLTAEFASAVLKGLSQKPRKIPSRFLYDETGSALFEEITRLDEYYPTRTEIGLLRDFGGEIASTAGPVETLIEFGSGSSRKTRLLIKALENLKTYVPIDISERFLAEAAESLQTDIPELSVRPVVGDFTKTRDLHGIEAVKPLGFFSGS
ncbi:MAG: L-histidine N(alpha)-methyltransferase, partial [Pseudomonadota bacterium]